jgi:hypothetical protein
MGAEASLFLSLVYRKGNLKNVDKDHVVETEQKDLPRGIDVRAIFNQQIDNQLISSGASGM